MLLKKCGELKKFGHRWEGREANVLMRSHYRSTTGNLVLVFPPSAGITSWYVLVCDDELYEVTGEDAMANAFMTAEAYTRQKRAA